MKALALIGSLSLVVSACGGGGGSSSNPPPPQANQKVGGIWNTRATLNGVTSTGVTLVAENGLYYTFSQNDLNGCAGLGTGTLTANGTSLSGPITAGLVTYSTIPGVVVNCVYPDGSQSATGTLTGTIAERSTISLTAAGRTSLGTTLPTITSTGTFDSLYNLDSSLAAIAGNWTGVEGIVVNINSNGVIFSQDPVSGCVVNGQISIIDANYNAYAVSALYSSCVGSAAVLNGRTATGLAAIDNTAAPTQLVTAYSVTLASGQLILAAGVATR
jgi:hypothetical protein